VSEDITNKIYNQLNKKSLRKELRNNAPVPEKILWNKIMCNKLGIKFQIALIFTKYEHLLTMAQALYIGQVSMKYIVFFIFLISAGISSADSNYKDSPVSLDSDTQALLRVYEEQARDTLNIFNKEFNENGQNIFYVTTRIYHDKNFEQIFVKLSSIEGGVYKGVIASSPLGKVDFKSGDKISVKSADVLDWLIVLPDGEERGNLQGKALDLLQVGTAAVITRMIPKDGKYISFTVVSVLNPQTKQEVIEILPHDVKTKIENYLATKNVNLAPEDNKEKYTYIFIRFPGWQIEEI
jgi:uncharacterized protein YegJ (DUF2314 family)